MAKINNLITKWEKGTAALTSYLNKNGYDNDLLNKYVKGNWLESLGYGAYKLKQDTINWEGAVYALQNHAGYSIHPGGKTALEIKGFAHYIPQGSATTDLFGAENEFLPKWFVSQKWSNQIHFTGTRLFNYKDLQAYSYADIQNFSIKISSPELAIMEMLHLVPQYYSFEEAYMIMEGLTSLRSKIVQELLKQCNSIKAKRLFLFMAEHNGHAWLNKIDTGKFSLGAGKRVIVPNGHLNRKYNITVPVEYE